MITSHPLADDRTLESHTSRGATDQDTRYRYRYHLTPTWVSESELQEPLLAERVRVSTAGVCIDASCQRGKGEAGMDAYQVRTWQGWHHHMALSVIAVWSLIAETHRSNCSRPP